MDIAAESNKVLKDLSSELTEYVDKKLGIPQVYKGNSEIKLIILGQDPTVKNVISRSKINTVLNLDKSGALKTYLNNICGQLSITLDNVYATNVLKNFFIAPPTAINKINIFQTFLPIWLPILKIELNNYPSVPIFALGEPLLEILAKEGVSKKVREYWNYNNDGGFRYLKAEDNILGRDIFPFPHQPSIRKKFYMENLNLYLDYLKEVKK